MRRWAVVLLAGAACAALTVRAATPVGDALRLRTAVLAWLVWLIVLACLRRSGETRGPIGTARLAHRGELRRLRRASAAAWFPLGYLPPRGPIRRLFRIRALRPWLHPLIGQQIRLPVAELARHVLVLGLTGARKTTSIVFPALLEAARREVSVVALDLKYGEADCLARVAHEWQRWGRDVQIFAPLDAGTLRWNPCGGCRTMGDAHRLAALLFEEIDPANPELLYWLGAERHVCAVLVHALSRESGGATLAGLRALCAAGPEAVRADLDRHPSRHAVAAALGAFQTMMPKDQAGILQGIASRLDAWADEAVASATADAPAWGRIDLHRLRRDPGLLIVGIPQAALGRLRWLSQVFLRDAAACLLAPRQPEERVPVHLVLEELTTWGTLPNLADHLATYRSRGVSVLATLQSEAQGEQIYGRAGWAAIAANLVTKIYLPSLADADAERVSRVLGTAGADDVAVSRAWGGLGGRLSEHRRAVPVPLARPEDVRSPARPPEDILVRFDRLPPGLLWSPPYTARPEYAEAVPERQPATPALAVYHHVRCRATDPVASVGLTAQRGAGRPDVQPSARPPDALAEVVPPEGRAAPGLPAASQVPPHEAAGDAAGGDDAERLDRLVAHALSGGSAGSPVICVRSGDRIVELRIAARVVAGFCGGTEEMHALAQRWSALRWVRRVRPTFVLTRRALGHLDRGLRGRLDALEAGPGGVNV